MVTTTITAEAATTTQQKQTAAQLCVFVGPNCND
jgi:hypothetical protein